MSLSDMKEQMRSLALKAQSVVDADDRTPAEKREEINKLEADIKGLSEKIADEQYLADQRTKFASMVAPEEAPAEKELAAVAAPRASRKSLGDQFIDSDAYKSVQGRKGSRFSSGQVETKATVTTAASGVVQPDVRPGVLDIRFQRLTIADLLAQGTTTSAVIRYFVETTATNAATAVAEEGEKPASDLIFDEVDEPLRKIATTLKASDEMLDDVDWVRSYINGRLMFFVEQALEDQILNGNGTPPNISGILDRSGLQTAEPVGASPDTAIEAIYRQITAIRANAFIEPDGLVVHPNDWMDIRLAKDGNDNYYGGGPFGQVGPDVLWGLPVVVTTAIAENTALIGAFRTGAQLFTRGGITVEMTNSDEDDFRFNRVTFRAEQRAALAVYRPGAFGTVTSV